ICCRRRRRRPRVHPLVADVHCGVAVLHYEKPKPPPSMTNSSEISDLPKAPPPPAIVKPAVKPQPPRDPFDFSGLPGSPLPHYPDQYPDPWPDPNHLCVVIRDPNSTPRSDDRTAALPVIAEDPQPLHAPVEFFAEADVDVLRGSHSPAGYAIRQAVDDSLH